MLLYIFLPPKIKNMANKNQFIGPEELTKIILKFFNSDFDLKATTQAFSDTKIEDQIIYTIKTGIKQHVIDIEYQLRRAQRINSLRIYDHIGMNKKMFHQFLNIGKILKKQHVQDFFYHFKYKRMNPSWYRLPKRVDMPVELIDSTKKLAIYQDFIKYFEQNKLFDINLQFQQERIDDMKQEFIIGQFPTTYGEQDICKIYRLFQLYNGDSELVLLKLKQQGFIDEKASIDNLQGLLIDCMITGLCRIFKSTNNHNLYMGYTWQKFRKLNKPLIAKNCSVDVRIALVRIGIYDNASKYEKKLICDSVGAKMRTKGHNKRDQKDTRYYRQKQGTRKALMDVIKNEMRGILKDQQDQ